jgi:hypothetical protein
MTTAQQRYRLQVAHALKRWALAWTFRTRTSKPHTRTVSFLPEGMIERHHQRPPLWSAAGVVRGNPMASQRQIAANKCNGAKSRGPSTQQGKARSRMNALRHGLAAVSIKTTAAFADDHPFADDSCLGAMYQRLRQIEGERVKAVNDVHSWSRSENLDTLHLAVRRLATLERYSQRSHSKLKRFIFLS